MNLAMLNNLFGPDMLIIFLVILLLFGAKKLPELAKGMGQAVREFSKAKDDIEREVTRHAEPEPPRQPPVESPRQLLEPQPGTTASAEFKPEPAQHTEPRETSRVV